MERLDREVLERELGPDVELERITRGLRCGGCGARDAQLETVWDAGGFKYGDG